MFIQCAAVVPGPVQPVPNNLLRAATLFFLAAVGRPWREAAPPIMLNLEKKTVGVQSPEYRTAPPPLGPCSILKDAAAPG